MKTKLRLIDNETGNVFKLTSASGKEYLVESNWLENVTYERGVYYTNVYKTPHGYFVRFKKTYSNRYTHVEIDKREVIL